MFPPTPIPATGTASHMAQPASQVQLLSKMEIVPGVALVVLKMMLLLIQEE